MTVPSGFSDKGATRVFRWIEYVLVGHRSDPPEQEGGDKQLRHARLYRHQPFLQSQRENCGIRKYIVEINYR